jgi:hypothetical protein
MLGLLFIFLAGVCNSIMDVLSFRYEISIFNKLDNDKWFNPKISWKNKWKDDFKSEKFLGSSTVFVMFIDAWHFFKFLMLSFIVLSIIFYTTLINNYIDIMILYLTFTITFELFWSKIWIKRIR